MQGERVGERGRLLGAVMTAALVLTGCMSDHGSASRRSASPSAAHHHTGAQAEKRLTNRAQSALDAAGGQGGTRVVSGVERVSDGVHTEPGLPPSGTYKLTVVCAGKGRAEITFTPAGAGSVKQVPCDGSVVFERFISLRSLRLDVRGKPGATGVMAWRIDRV